MALNIFDTACNADCTVVNLPAIAEDQDCISFEDFRSQISDLLFVHPDGNMPADWKSRDSWTAIVDNALQDVNAAKYLTGIGGMPPAEKTKRVVAKAKTKTVRRRFTITFDVLNMSDENYKFLEALQCNDTKYRIWIGTIDGHLFGGQNGISVVSIDANMALSEGGDDYEQGQIIIVFDALYDPPRTRILNLSENFASGNVTPTAYNVWGSSPNNVWGSSPDIVWGSNN